jgi:hypothetical protein
MHYDACKPIQCTIVKTYQVCKTDKNIYASKILTQQKKPVELITSQQRDATLTKGKQNVQV